MSHYRLGPITKIGKGPQITNFDPWKLTHDTEPECAVLVSNGFSNGFDTKKIDIQKRIGFGIVKVWNQKNIGFCIEKIWYRKKFLDTVSFRFWVFWVTFWFRNFSIFKMVSDSVSNKFGIKKYWIQYQND